LALALFLLPVTAAAWSGKVVGVIEGDSITVLHAGRQEQIRLWGIDCPEKHQDFGTKAKDATSILVFAKVVEKDSLRWGDRHTTDGESSYLGGKDGSFWRGRYEYELAE
jgi:endonuclease YncB( thermonuclease family)